MWSFLSLVLAYLSLAGAHARNDKATGHVSWFPSLRLLFKHSDHALADYLAEISAKGFNHDHVGATALTPPLHYPASREAVPKGFRVNTRRQLLGKGRKVYERAVQVGLRERGVVNRIPWANLIFADQDWKQWKTGTCLLTFVKCYGLLWSANPCKLIYAHWDKKLPREMGRGKYSSMGFSTVSGHLIAGEERFSIEFSAEDSNVWLDLYSVSRGAGLLGKVAMPLIRPLQKTFFAEQCRQMLRLVEEDTE